MIVVAILRRAAFIFPALWYVWRLRVTTRLSGRFFGLCHGFILSQDSATDTGAGSFVSGFGIKIASSLRQFLGLVWIILTHVVRLFVGFGGLVAGCLPGMLWQIFCCVLVVGHAVSDQRIRTHSDLFYRQYGEYTSTTADRIQVHAR